MVDPAFRLKMMEGYGLTTAHIFYRLPDARSLLNEFTWQFEDVHPRFPKLNEFLKYWDQHIEGPIHSVLVAHQRLIKPAEIRMIGKEFRLQ